MRIQHAVTLALVVGLLVSVVDAQAQAPIWEENYENHLLNQPYDQIADWDTMLCGPAQQLDGCNPQITTEVPAVSGTHTLKFHYDPALPCSAFDGCPGSAYYDRYFAIYNGQPAIQDVWTRFYYRTHNWEDHGIESKMIQIYETDQNGVTIYIQSGWGAHYPVNNASNVHRRLNASLRGINRFCGNGTGITDGDCNYPMNVQEILIQDDQWYCVEFHLRPSTANQSDGLLEQWINGTLVASYPNILTRTSNAGYFFYRTYAQTGRGDKYLDDVAIGASRIGCGATPPSSPTAPTNLRLSSTATQVLTVVPTGGTGTGTVTSSPIGIDCGATCSASFAPDTQVTLTAAPAAGSTFTGWSGGCSGSSLTCVVTMSGPTSVTATFALIPSSGCPGGPGTCVAVDLNVNTGAANYRYNGFNNDGVTSADPPDAIVVPLKPSGISVRGGDTATYTRGVNLGAEVMWGIAHGPLAFFLGSEPGVGGSCINNEWVGGKWTNFTINPTYPFFGTIGNGDTFENVVRSLAAQFSPSIVSSVIGRFWTEPDNPNQDSVYQPAFLCQWNEMYRRMVLTLRADYPGFRIAAPEHASYVLANLQNFLSFAKAKNVLPDVLAWHEIIYPDWNVTGLEYVGQGNFSQRVDDVRAYMTALNISSIPISIGEFLWPTTYLYPGGVIVSYANMQRKGITVSKRACWQDTGGFSSCGPNGNGVVTPPANNISCSSGGCQKRPVWHAMKAYADLTGSYRRLTAGNSFDGLAALDTGVLRIILGNAGGSNVNVVVGGMSALTANTTVNVTVQRIPVGGNNGSDPLLNPVTVVNNQPFTVSGGTLTIPISGSSQWDGYAITVTP